MRRQRCFDGKDKVALRKLIWEKTGYMPVSNSILSQAFRRSSYCKEDGGKSNEMFEFIGDQVLGFYTVKVVSQRCCAVNSEGDRSFLIRQNQFSALKQELLSNEAFAKIIVDWGVADYLIVGRDDEKNEVNKQTKIKADLFEAIIGAITIECKWDPVILENVVSRALNLDERINAIIESEQQWHFDIDNAVTKLKELAEKEVCSQPSYEFAGPEFLGYDADGAPIWSCTCVVADWWGSPIAVFSGSKTKAKKAAAYLTVCRQFQMQNLYGPNQLCSVWTYKNGKLMPGDPEQPKRNSNNQVNTD